MFLGSMDTRGYFDFDLKSVVAVQKVYNPLHDVGVHKDACQIVVLYVCLRYRNNTKCE